MNKSLFLLVTLIYLNINAQSNEIKKANDFLFEYQNNKKVEDLNKALENAKLAMSNESNSNDAFSNYIYGLVLKTHYDANGQNDHETIINSYTSLKKSIDLGAKLSEKDKSQAFKLIKYIAFDFYNAGINLHNAKKSDQALNMYRKLYELIDFMSLNKQTLAIDGQSELKKSDVNTNYVVFAVNSNKNDEAIKILKEDVQQNPTESKYTNLVQLLKDNSEERKKYLNEGLTKYPNNLDLIISDINISLAEKNNTNAKAKLQKAIEINPKNHQFYLILGNLLESEKDSENAKKNYTKAIEINPSDFESNYNLAVIQFNEAIQIYNKNTSNEKGSEIYMPYFKTAKSTLEKCKQLQPSNNDVDKLIQKINDIK